MLFKYSTLKPKDVDYREFILRNGVVTPKQVMLKSQEAHKNHAYRRLRKLTNPGYVVNKRVMSRLGVYIGTTDAREQVEAEVTVPKSEHEHSAACSGSDGPYSVLRVFFQSKEHRFQL